MSDQRSAKTSPRRAPVAPDTSRNAGRHHGPEALSQISVCCAGVRAMPRRFFGTGGSLRDTGLFATSPHLTARANALDTTPAMFRTVLAERWRDALVRRSCPPLHGETTRHEYRDVTALSWGRRFHAPIFVSQPALQLVEAAGGVE